MRHVNRDAIRAEAFQQVSDAVEDDKELQCRRRTGSTAERIRSAGPLYAMALENGSACLAQSRTISLETCQNNPLILSEHRPTPPPCIRAASGLLFGRALHGGERERQRLGEASGGKTADEREES